MVRYGGGFRVGGSRCGFRPSQVSEADAAANTCIRKPWYREAAAGRDRLFATL